MKKQYYLSLADMNIFQNYLRRGTENAKNQFDARRILLLNLFFAVGFLALLVSLIESRVTGEPVIMSVMLGGAMVLMLGVPVLGRKNPNLGSAYLLLLANLIVWTFANSQGLASGTYFYYFPLFFANGWLMDFRKPWNAILLLMMTVTGVAATVLIPESLFGLSLPLDIQETSFVFNLIMASFVMAVNTLVIVWVNYRRQHELEERIEQVEQTGKKLELALKEKEVLLSEIHHRVKNNLAVVRGLLNMQMQTSKDENARATLRESVGRVSSMALIHQRLYSNIDPSKIDFKKYVTELVNEIASTYKNNSRPEPNVQVDITNVSINLNKAVPCGLILNELLTNCFKHAFKDQSDPLITITIATASRNLKEIDLLVEDNGCGMTAGTDHTGTETLGMMLIHSLADQLDGRFTFEQGAKKGTRARLVFPDNFN